VLKKQVASLMRFSGLSTMNTAKIRITLQNRILHHFGVDVVELQAPRLVRERGGPLSCRTVGGNGRGWGRSLCPRAAARPDDPTQREPLIAPPTDTPFSDLTPSDSISSPRTSIHPLYH